MLFDAVLSAAMPIISSRRYYRLSLSSIMMRRGERECAADARHFRRLRAVSFAFRYGSGDAIDSLRWLI